jgi:hypothetical protein
MASIEPPSDDDEGKQERAFFGGCFALIIGLIFAFASMLYGIIRVLEHHR